MSVIFNPPQGSNGSPEVVYPLKNTQDDIPSACEINTVSTSTVIETNKQLYLDISKLISDTAQLGLFQATYEGTLPLDAKDSLIKKKYILVEETIPGIPPLPEDQNENFDLEPISTSTNVPLNFELKLTFPGEMQLSDGYVFFIINGFPDDVFHISDCNAPGYPSVDLTYSSITDKTEIVFSDISNFALLNYLDELSIIIDPLAILDMTDQPFEGTPLNVWNFQLENDPLLPPVTTVTNTIISWPNSVCVGTL